MYKKEERFHSFPIQKIIDNSRTNFNLFVNIDDDYVLYSGKQYKWERQELAELLKRGFNQLYIRDKDKEAAHSYQTINSLPKINRELAPKERIKNIEDVGMHFAQTLYKEKLTDASLYKAEEIAEAITDTMLEEPACIKELSGLGDFDMYTYYHSVRVACYSVAIAQMLGMTNQKDLSQIGLGCMLHDIGKKEVGLDIINKQGALTHEEWRKMQSHPQLGYNLIENSVLHHVPREIILHHHEKLNGSGYPHGIGSQGLIDEVKIATLADIFDALTSSRSYQNKRSRFEALQLIKHKLVGSEVDGPAFLALVQLLGSD